MTLEWMQMDITLCRLIRLRTSLRALCKRREHYDIYYR